MTKPLVIFSTQGWTDLWVSKHWIANEFSKERCVLFVEPPVRVTPSQIIRCDIFRPQLRKIRENLFALQTVTFPFPFRVPSIFRPLWRTPIKYQFDKALRDLNITDFDVLNFDPHSMSLVHKYRNRIGTAIYYAVDPPLGKEDFFWPERRCVRESDAVFAVTPTLKNLIVSESGREDVEVLPHGVDYSGSQVFEEGHPHSYGETFSKISDSDTVIGYTGSIHDVCIEESTVVQAIRKRPDWKFVFVGPYKGSALSKKSLDISRFKSFENVFFVGAVPYKQLKYFIRRFDVCIVPYDNKANDNWERRSPFKVLGYLAQGKPVVISNVPAAQYYRDHVFIYEKPDEFLPACEAALRSKRDAKSRRKFAAQHDFSRLKRKISKFLA